MKLHMFPFSIEMVHCSVQLACFSIEIVHFSAEMAYFLSYYLLLNKYDY